MNYNSQKWYTCPCFQLFLLFAASFCFKIMLIPAYYSTDHDVHQNWLRITANKPFTQWYYDNQSRWTLDYPPLFAYFQWILSWFSQFIDPNIANSINEFKVTIYYQRITVMLSQIPFLLVLYWIFKEINAKLAIAYFSIPFILLDNIHFQYNIIMQAVFLLSVQLMRRKRFQEGAFVYSFLLNFKHLYLYSALAFFVCIIKQYILDDHLTLNRIKKLVKIGIITVIPFILSFGPFLVAGGFSQIFQILSRLFPFQRGLIHDYWAPNFWALYYFLDKMLNLVIERFSSQSISMKQVGELHKLSVLPNIEPVMTTLIILAFSLPIIIIYFRKKVRFQLLVFLCGCIFFIFGFHVHQKAITPYIGLLLVFMKKDEQKRYLLDPAIFINILSLLPLLIDPNEKLLRIILPLLWIAIWQRKTQISSIIEVTIVTIGLGILFFQQCIHPVVFRKRMQFLPLMLNSVYCAAFNICWIIEILKLYITQKSEERDEYKPIPNQSEQ